MEKSMKVSQLFILFISFSSLLISLCLWLYSEPIHLKRLEVIRISKIQKVCMKDYARKRDYHIPERTVKQAQLKIDELLKLNPIFLESNQSKEITLGSNKIVLEKVTKVLNNMSEDVVLNISVHTDENGSNQYNLEVSQNRADRLKAYFEKRSNILLVTSIGYGEEFPRMESDEKLSNRRIEISLKRLQQ